MRTDTSDLEGELSRYLDRLRSLGGIDIFFLGFGPEANAASHLAYIKPGSGATANDLAGVIPVLRVFSNITSVNQSRWQHCND